MRSARTIFITVLLRGLRKRCPQCGVGKIFIRWYTIDNHCAQCHLDFIENQSNTWAFMYISTAFLTGLIIVAMLLIHPQSLWLSRFWVMLMAFFIIAGSMPYRKGLAMAIEYLVELKWHNHKNLQVQFLDHDNS